MICHVVPSNRPEGQMKPRHLSVLLVGALALSHGYHGHRHHSGHGHYHLRQYRTGGFGWSGYAPEGWSTPASGEVRFETARTTLSVYAHYLPRGDRAHVDTLAAKRESWHQSGSISTDVEMSPSQVAEKTGAHPGASRQDALVGI
jgi:hypothetical protein